MLPDVHWLSLSSWVYFKAWAAHRPMRPKDEVETTYESNARGHDMTTRLLLNVMLLGGLASVSTGCGGNDNDKKPAPSTGGSNTAGGSAMAGGGSSANGGNAGSAGTSNVPVCVTVSTLPQQYTACSTVGESQCLQNGNRCVCERGVWYCNANCSNIPQPTPNGDCSNNRGAACVYASGVSCACVSNRWMCIGASGCPTSAPITGNACNNLTGQACDYPGSPHLACACTANADAGTGSTWTCIASAVCPATQPAYPTTCDGAAICSYGNTKCACVQAGTYWLCL